MDGFDQDEAEGERDEGTVIARSLLATKGDALEALEFADGLLDARPRFVEDFREESGSLGVLDARAACPQGRRLSSVLRAV